MEEVVRELGLPLSSMAYMSSGDVISATSFTETIDGFGLPNRPTARMLAMAIGTVNDRQEVTQLNTFNLDDMSDEEAEDFNLIAQDMRAEVQRAVNEGIGPESMPAAKDILKKLEARRNISSKYVPNVSSLSNAQS